MRSSKWVGAPPRLSGAIEQPSWESRRWWAGSRGSDAVRVDLLWVMPSSLASQPCLVPRLLPTSHGPTRARRPIFLQADTWHWKWGTVSSRSRCHVGCRSQGCVCCEGLGQGVLVCLGPWGWGQACCQKLSRPQSGPNKQSNAPMLSACLLFLGPVPQ